MKFDSRRYGRNVAEILALGEEGQRPMPLAAKGCWAPEAQQRLDSTPVSVLFEQARFPEAAMSGLYLYFGCFEQAHHVAQNLHSLEGSYWHAILHRQEPDAGNSAYWFHRVGIHPVYNDLAAEVRSWTEENGFPVGDRWDPFAFIDFCESARRKPGSTEESLAMKIQLLEWQMLFDHCARPA